MTVRYFNLKDYKFEIPDYTDNPVSPLRGSVISDCIVTTNVSPLSGLGKYFQGILFFVIKESKQSIIKSCGAAAH
ncbi:MAG: hypothetical protein P4L45_01800 [Ignavibacteriaceae bacterium]|nr:hypothetical protein [Ignavibacteriaceae bacterium]